MPRGISQEDVWNACDALLLEGARPTIERVRQKLGRGSPNTVSPMLETWFRHLGARITDPGAFAVPAAMPDPVQQAAKHLWEVAQAEARRDVDDRVNEGLAAATANVEAEKEKAAIAESAAFSATSKVAHLQAELEQLRAALDAERLEHRSTRALLEVAQQRGLELQAELAQTRQVAFDERARAEQAVVAADGRAAGAERRAAMEIERERQLRAKAEKSAESIAKRFEAALKEQIAATQQLHATEERLAHQQSLISRHEEERLRLVTQHEARTRELEAALDEANIALSRSAAQNVLVEQIVAKLSSHGERRAWSDSATATPSARKRKTTA